MNYSQNYSQQEFLVLATVTKTANDGAHYLVLLGHGLVAGQQLNPKGC